MFISKGLKALGGAIVPILIFSQTAMATPMTITWQNAPGQMASVSYTNALSTPAMKAALTTDLQAAESAVSPIFVTDTNGSVINYEAALGKSEGYNAALADTTVQVPTAPAATYQMNADGTISIIQSTVTVASVSAANGTVTVNLSSAPTTLPTVADFAVTQAINGGTATTVTPTAVSTSASGTGAIVTLTVPTISGAVASQSVVDSVSYKSATAVAAPAFTVAAITLGVSSVSAPNLGTVQVVFNAAVDSATATNVANYTIGVLNIAKATLASDNKTVTLYVNNGATPPVANMVNATAYTLKASGVTAGSGSLTLASTSVQFTTNDLTIPQVSGVTATGNSTLQVVFNEPVLGATAAGALANDYVVDSTNSGITITAGSGSMDSTGTILTMSTSSPLTAGVHTLAVVSQTANKITGFNAATLTPMAPMSFNVSAVSALTSVTGVTVNSQTQVTVNFSQAMPATLLPTTFTWGGHNADTVKQLSSTSYQVNFTTNPLPVGSVTLNIGALNDVNGQSVILATGGNYALTVTANTATTVSSLTETKDNSFVITFSSAVTALPAGNITFTNSAGTIINPGTPVVVAGTNNTQWTLPFATAVAPATYTVAVSGVVDAIGNTVTAYSNSNFTVTQTTAPSLTTANVQYEGTSILVNFGSAMATTGVYSVTNANNYQYNGSALPSGTTITAVNNNQSVLIAFSALTAATDTISVGYVSGATLYAVQTAAGLTIAPSNPLAINGLGATVVNINVGSTIKVKSPTQVSVKLAAAQAALGSNLTSSDFTVNWTKNGAPVVVIPSSVSLDSTDTTNHTILLNIATPIDPTCTSVTVSNIAAPISKDMFGVVIPQVARTTAPATTGYPQPALMSAGNATTASVDVILSGSFAAGGMANLANSLHLVQNGTVIPITTTALAAGAPVGDGTWITVNTAAGALSTTAPVTVSTVSQSYVNAQDTAGAYLLANTTGVTSNSFDATTVTLSAGGLVPGATAAVLFTANTDATSVPTTAVTATLASNGTLTVPGFGVFSGFNVTTPGSFSVTVSGQGTATLTATVGASVGAAVVGAANNAIWFTPASTIKAGNGSVIDATFVPETATHTNF